MERMNQADERKLIKNVESVIKLANDSGNPNDALLKVAQDNNLTPQLIRRVGEAYNQSRTLFELSEKRGSDRLGSFELADPDYVISAMYPKEPKLVAETHLTKAASDWYASKPTNLNFFQHKPVAKPRTLEKVASAAPAKTKLQVNMEKRAYAAAADDKMVFKETLVKCAHSISDELRQAFPVTPFHKLEIAAYHKFGNSPIVENTMNLMWKLSRAEKFGQRRALASERDVSRYTVTDFKMPGFASVESLVSAATNLHKAANNLNKMPKLPEQKKFYNPKKDEAGTSTEKKSSLFDPITSAVGGGLSAINSKIDGAKSQYKSELEKNVTKLEDPAFKNSLQQINVEAMLHNLLTNDDVISTYDPEEVVDHFNRIQEVAPLVSSKAGVMRDLLRRSLAQGGLEAMEIGQASQLEGSLRDANTPDREDRLRGLLASPSSINSSNTNKPSNQLGE